MFKEQRFFLIVATVVSSVEILTNIASVLLDDVALVIAQGFYEGKEGRCGVRVCL